MSTFVYSTAVTPWFIAAQQAVTAGGAAVNLLGGTLNVGDGHGTVPTLSSILANNGVLNQVWTGAPNSVAVNASNSAQIDVGCLIPTVNSSGVEIGPFNVTEFAIYDATGHLCLYGTTNLVKTVSSMGMLTTLQWFASYVESASNAVTVQPPTGSFPTLGQVQTGVAGLLSATSPVAITAALQSSGWTNWNISIAAATAAAVGVGRPATDAEFAAGAAAASPAYQWPWATLQQIKAAFALFRTRLTANANFYVATTGSDTTGNGSAGSPWATVAYAYFVLLNYYDQAGFTATINVGAGTIAAGVAGPAPTTGHIVINGAGAGSTAFVTVNASCFSFNSPGYAVTIQNLSVSATGSTGGNGIIADNGAVVLVSGVTFGSMSGSFPAGGCGAQQIRGGTVVVNGPLTVTGSMVAFVWTDSLGKFYLNSQSVTYSAPTFSTGNAVCEYGGYQSWTGTLSGSATGCRFNVQLGGFINTYGGGANFLPGTLTGVGTSYGNAPYGLYQ